MNVTVRLFAILRERAGERVELQLPAGATVRDALSALAALPSLSGLLERLPVQMAVNRDYATPHTPLAAGDELALIPPVSGGADGLPLSGGVSIGGGADGNRATVHGGERATVHARVTDGPLSLDALARVVSHPRAGAIVTFQGTTREVSRLDYEAYREMAEERLVQIAGECASRHGLCAAAVEHRIGSVALGESSVIVAVSSPHRPEAFLAAREIVDRVKVEAPIWKQEVDSDGVARRVDGTPAPGASLVEPPR